MNYKINVKCEIKNANEELKDNIELLKKEYLELILYTLNEKKK